MSRGYLEGQRSLIINCGFSNYATEAVAYTPPSQNTRTGCSGDWRSVQELIITFQRLWKASCPGRPAGPWWWVTAAREWRLLLWYIPAPASSASLERLLSMNTWAEKRASQPVKAGRYNCTENHFKSALRGSQGMGDVSPSPVQWNMLRV